MSKTETSRPSFVAALCELRGGLTVEELDQSLAELVAAVRETGKPGAIVLTIKAKKLSKGEDVVSILSLDDAIVAKIPQLDKGSTVFFADEAGHLARNDPRQQRLFDDGKSAKTPEPAAAPPANVHPISGGGAR